MKKLVICEINESYLKNVKEQMKKQNMPMPKDDSHITIAHKPLGEVELNNITCDCITCSKIKNLL